MDEGAERHHELRPPGGSARLLDGLIVPVRSGFPQAKYRPTMAGRSFCMGRMH